MQLKDFEDFHEGDILRQGKTGQPEIVVARIDHLGRIYFTGNAGRHGPYSQAVMRESFDLAERGH